MEHVEELCENICMLHRSNTILQGGLKEIKASFPKERVILETETSIDGLERLQGVTSVNHGLDGYELRISHPEAAQGILQFAMERSAIQRFQIMEPTLNEIFIQKVGNSHE
ncbi:hypothetical protein D3C85_1657200 [compost metagenome]